ncbi:TIGR03619 family F420-dependent LLM class oxidoreductase [Amycolatopsis sp. CA-230715]|uniref:TIGR03619 family F420-dependent LLM class oxidoreductase n=1 Tax=Amycolatopsis sp. CA-230715 TaxID=2745196 RepID=UPI001C012A36|nr:TIGR03619 family F420-dependent LLM class oxidoreductase [Amycolatopsis sp. CA-230715]QWF82513.1 F420-dependent glucose-6-phosphate dehydrogenase [Amycolatopsis sp. CA-230715]
MRIQAVLPDESSTMDPQEPVRLAVLAEELGYETVWLPDHVLPPAEYGEVYGGVYEPLVTLSYVAAKTSRIRLGTSVLVLPLRNPFVLAKQVATVDRLSGGRVTLGVGIGWDATEFANVGAEFATRGARTDEGIRLLRHLFGGGGPFSGRFHSYTEGVFEPRPTGKVPIMVGGTSKFALRRAVSLADEWQGVGLTPAEFAEHAAALSTSDVSAGTRIDWRGGQETAALAAEFARAGADSLAIHFGAHTDYAARLTDFASRAQDSGLLPRR